MAFYWASQPSSKLTFEIWVGADKSLVDDTLHKQLETICTDAGMKKFDVRTYNPQDHYYPQAFALQANTVAIYILGKDEATAIAETGMFRTIDGQYGQKNTLSYNGDVIGVEFVEGYYVLINNNSKKSSELLMAVFDAVVNYEVKR